MSKAGKRHANNDNEAAERLDYPTLLATDSSTVMEQPRERELPPEHQPLLDEAGTNNAHSNQPTDNVEYAIIMLKPPKQPLKTRFTEQNKTETSTSKVGSAAKWQDNYAELPEPNEKLSNQSITEGPEIQPLLPKLNSQHTGDPEFRTRQQTVINQLTNYVKQPNLKASFSKTPPKPAQLSPAEASDVSPDKLSREQPMPAPALPPKPTHLQTKANENTPKVKWRDDHGGPLSDTIELEEHSTLSQEATIKANPYAAAFSTDTAFNEAISPPPTKTNGTGDRSTISLLITELNALQHLLKHNHTASQAIDPSSELEQSSYLPTTVANTQTLPEDPTPLVGEESPITQ